MVEINQGKGLSIAAIAQKRLGRPGKHLASISLLVLFWSLLAAYISGGSSIVHQELGGSSSLIAILYTLILGVCVAVCTKMVDYTNRILFVSKCVIFLVIIFGLAPFIQLSHLKTAGVAPLLALPQAIPVFFTSFGFHGSLPSLIQYLHGDKKSIYFTIIVGSLIPLIIYILWQTITLGILDGTVDSGGNVGLFISKLTEQTKSGHLTFLTDLFAFLAIATSFLGVALGLFDYISEWFAKEEHAKKKNVNKVKVALLTFALPLLFSLFYPQGFVFALGFAAISLSLLAVILPSLIALVEKSHSSTLLKKAVAFFMLLSGIGIVCIEIFSKF